MYKAVLFLLRGGTQGYTEQNLVHLISKEALYGTFKEARVYVFRGILWCNFEISLTLSDPLAHSSRPF